jgi:LysR family transcriptional regulator of beta-lactamase
MVRPHLPLTALRAFEASARHLSFTRAAIELCVTQAAVSHQVKSLEQRLGVSLFRRLPRGLLITDEGLALLPTLRDSFDRIAGMLEKFDDGHVREVLEVGGVGTFAVGWLLPRLRDFRERHPFVDVRISTNNNRVDLAAEGLDYAVRFGNGAWHDTEAEALFEAPLSPLCVPEIAETLREPADLVRHVLLRSYRTDEWPAWFEAAAVAAPTIRGPVFDSSLTMVEAALQGEGVALAPPMMFFRQLAAGALQQPFGVSTSRGCYWLTRLKSRNPTPAMDAFRTWLLDAARNSMPAPLSPLSDPPSGYRPA